MARTARVALLQLRAFSLEDAEASLAHTLARIDEAARERPDIIVTPEMTYPAYLLGSGDLSTLAVSPGEAAERIAARARGHGVYIAAGIALDDGLGGWVNGAALFGRDGALAGQTAKSFLWHFDTKWFTPGDEYPVIETDVARIGMLVCADARAPEIARSLALNGAQIILDLTAWVSGARRDADLTSVQREYIMQTRAFENGVWIAAADKTGVEAESIVYCGRSCVISPRGEYAASLGPEDDGTLVHDVPVEDAAEPIVRRPELYGVLTKPTETLPVLRTLDEPFVPPRNQHGISVVQMAMPATGEEFVAAARRHVERLRMQDAELVLFPVTPSRLRAAYPHDEVLAGMQRIASDTGAIVAFTVSEPDADGWRAMYLVGPDGIVLKHRQSHKPPGPRFETMPMGDEPCGIAETPVGRVGMMVAAEGSVPEVARSLMLRGAEIILWAGDRGGASMEFVARCRADENRVFVATTAAPDGGGATMIVEPSSRTLAIALEGRELAVSADVNPALAHIKQRAPGTDVVLSRQPAAYSALTRAEATVGPVV